LDLRSRISKLFASDREFRMKELFGNQIKKQHAKLLHCLILESGSEVVYLNFHGINVIDVNFFKELRKLSGDRYANIRYVNINSSFRMFI